jgi:hypothetical protein
MLFHRTKQNYNPQLSLDVIGLLKPENLNKNKYIPMHMNVPKSVLSLQYLSHLTFNEPIICRYLFNDLFTSRQSAG